MSNKTIHDILEEDEGMPVVGLTARVTKVPNSPFKGTGENGPYTLLFLTVTDQTGSIPVTWGDPPDEYADFPSCLMGQMVAISAHKGAKGGLIGAKTKIYKGAMQIAASKDAVRVGVADPRTGISGAMRGQASQGSLAMTTGNAVGVGLPGRAKVTDQQLLNKIQEYSDAAKLAGFTNEDSIAKLISTLWIAAANGSITLAEMDSFPS